MVLRGACESPPSPPKKTPPNQTWRRITDRVQGKDNEATQTEGDEHYLKTRAEEHS